ncbi:unnamed protein product [Scytosiphon promiscuus]
MARVAARGNQEQRMSLNQELGWALQTGSLKRVDRALKDGADVNGFGTDLPPPIVGAARLGHVDILKLLIDRGAKLETALCTTDSEGPAFLLGVRAVHAAVEGGRVGALRLLLRAGADPNSSTAGGATALMLDSVQEVSAATRLEMMDALLSAGADPLLGNKNQRGWKPIHYAARRGETLLMKKLLLSAPTTLNALDADERSPLLLASHYGHEDTVSFLLSAGASKARNVKTNLCAALFAAVHQGKEKVVRVLLDEDFEAAGGLFVIPGTMAFCVERDNGLILQMLLNIEGEGMREAWAGAWAHPAGPSEDSLEEPILSIAARFCSYRAAHVLLSAGADELAVNDSGKRASDIIGSSVGNSAKGSRQVAKEAAFGRMLKRGPAFRARSWLWPTPGKPVPEIASEWTRPVSSSERVSALGVRSLRQKDRTFLPRTLARYAVGGEPALLDGF